MESGRDGGRSLVQARMLSEEQAEAVFQAALAILERTGVRVESDEALRLLRGGGAIVDGDRARIPRELVKASIESAPKRLVIHGRSGASPLRLGEGNTYYAPGMTCPNVLDPLTGEHRPFGRRDCSVVGLLSDVLSNVDYVSGGGIIEDVTPTLAAAYEFAELAANTGKPILGWAHDEVVLEDIYQMACALAGGEEAFRERPNYVFFVNPVSPLVHSPEVVGRILFAAKNRMPIIVWPAVLAGGTVPVTIAGGAATVLAEVLSALAIHQSAQPGAPFIFGGSISSLDMRRGLAVPGPTRSTDN